MPDPATTPPDVDFGSDPIITEEDARTRLEGEEEIDIMEAVDQDNGDELVEVTFTMLTSTFDAICQHPHLLTDRLIAELADAEPEDADDDDGEPDDDDDDGDPAEDEESEEEETTQTRSR